MRGEFAKPPPLDIVSIVRLHINVSKIRSRRRKSPGVGAFDNSDLAEQNALRFVVFGRVKKFLCDQENQVFL